MEENLSALDSVREKQKTRIIFAQKQRFLKKQQRGRTRTKQISKYGPGYKSGEFALEKHSVESELSSEEDIAPEPTTSVPSPESSEPEEYCSICKGTDENRLIGIGLGLKYVEEELDWVACDKCNRWYHQLCLDEPDDDVFLESGTVMSARRVITNSISFCIVFVFSIVALST